MSNKPIISILIPTYNGEEFFRETLDCIVSQLNDKVELVICDDCSKDNTFAIAQQYANNYPQIKLYKNEKNLGMDGNFEKVATYATGEYIWYCGQDDIFGEGAIKKAAEVVLNHPEIDFIYMNFSRHSHNMDKIILERHVNINENVYCENHSKFLNITTLGQLPSFLPSFIMRKSLFDIAEKQRFYGTQFIQLGALFSVIKEMKLYIIAQPLIKGRVPENRWQSNNYKLLDILSGDLEVIKYACKSYKVVNKKLYKAHYKKVRKWLFNTLLDVKRDDMDINNKLIKRFKYIFDLKDLFLVSLIIKIPNIFFKNQFFYKLIKILR